MVEPGSDTETVRDQQIQKFWPQLRRFLVFQIKLYVDALRDLLLSALSLGAFVLDVVLQNPGPNCYFERVLKFGRRTERAINLFNQFDPEQQGPASVDTILNEVEDRFRSR